MIKLSDQGRGTPIFTVASNGIHKASDSSGTGDTCLNNGAGVNGTDWVRAPGGQGWLKGTFPDSSYCLATVGTSWETVDPNNWSP